MLCKEFQEMTNRERIEFIGKLNHAAMNDSKCFSFASTLLNYAELNNLFDDVIINPPRGQAIENY